MTKDFYSLLGSLQSLLYYLYKPDSGQPAEFFEQLADGSLTPDDALLSESFATVRNFYLLAAGSARSLALAVKDLRHASRELQEHPDLQRANRRVLAAGAAGISLEATGSNSWFDSAVAHAADATLPPSTQPASPKELMDFARKLRATAERGQKFETSLIATASQAEQLCSQLRHAGGEFYESLQPLLITIGEFDPELKSLLSQVLSDIKQSLGLDGSGDSAGTWPSSYVSSSSSSSGNYYSSSSSG